MNVASKVAALALGISLLGFAGKAPRSTLAKDQFRRAHPCPVTNENSPNRCPGQVIDHLVPLCYGGQDSPVNMQWQEYTASKEKDKYEVELCHGKLSWRGYVESARKLPPFPDKASFKRPSHPRITRRH